MDSWVVILPPLLAIVMAIATRQVFLSLFAGVWMGWTVLAGWNPLTGLANGIDALVAVFQSAYNTKVILFSSLIGALITLTQRSGGVEAFVRQMQRMNIGKTRRSASLVAWFTGMVVFVESSITCLVVGAVSRPLCDRVHVSREKLAYICDSTSAPVCILIPLNAWGAYVMGLLVAQGVDHPLAVLLSSIPLNFYALGAILLVVLVIMTGRDIGPMRRAERRAREEGKVLADGAIPMVSTEVIQMAPKDGVPLRSINFLLPLATLILMMPVGLYLTGRQGLTSQGSGEAGFFAIMGEGSGSTAVLWAVLAAITVAAVLYLTQRLFRLSEVMSLVLAGAGGLIPMAVIMILAFAINDTCTVLGTGPYIARVTQAFLNPTLLPAILFGVSALIAFSTGTSWGTFGIMMPIGIPLVTALDGHLALTVAAILGGGVFGDHASPISDTTVISSMATASDHIDHVRTQLPYALLTATVAFLAYLVAGLLVG